MGNLGERQKPVVSQSESIDARAQEAYTSRIWTCVWRYLFDQAACYEVLPCIFQEVLSSTYRSDRHETRITFWKVLTVLKTQSYFLSWTQVWPYTYLHGFSHFPKTEKKHTQWILSHFLLRKHLIWEVLNLIIFDLNKQGISSKDECVKVITNLNKP